jgi:hypothetical protein
VYRAVQQLAAVRGGQPALRYGRQYVRPLSGDGTHFGVSATAPGVLAFARLLDAQEVLVVANCNTQAGWAGQVIVDADLNPPGTPYHILYSNTGSPAPAGSVLDKPAGSVEIHEVDGTVTAGPARALPVQLQAMELQVLRR